MGGVGAYNGRFGPGQLTVEACGGKPGGDAVEGGEFRGWGEGSLQLRRRQGQGCGNAFLLWIVGYSQVVL